MKASGTAPWPLQVHVPVPVPVPVPVHFGLADAPLFGWYHAALGTPRLAVLLCGTWGDEELGAHRGLHDLAGQLAQHGLPVLRFDLAGEGDSFDPDLQRDADRWPLWLASAQAALALLKECSGAPALAVLGLRLGALLAAHAASLRDDVAALVALLPPASGRAWLREMRLMTREPGGALADGTLVVGGFELNAATVTRLAGLGLPLRSGDGDVRGVAASRDAPVLPHALLLDRSDLPLPDSALAAWRGFATVLVHDRRDDLGAVLGIAHSARLPLPVQHSLVAWLSARADEGARPAAGRPDPESESDPESAAAGGLRAGGSGASAQGLHESVVRIDGRLIGVLSTAAAADGARSTRDPAAEAPAAGLLLLSSGAERHIGPHRLWVPLARQRARRGEVVLRLDLPGLGDSPSRPGEPEAHIYDARAADDVAAAVAWLRREQAVGPVTVVGICSGAYHAWRAALGGAALQTVVSVNPLVFHWQPGMSLDPAAHAFGQIAIAAQAARASRDPRRWLKLLCGRVNVRVILAAVLAQAAAAMRRKARGLCRLAAGGAGRRPAWRGGHDLAREMQLLAQQGVVAHFVFSEGEPGRTLLEREAGEPLARLSRDGHVHLATVEGADHTFTRQAARQRLYNQLNPLLDAASRRRTPVPTSHDQPAAAPRPASSQRPTFS